MKKFIKYLFIPVLAAGLSSCNFLDENMNTKYSDEDIFGSESALETYINGCYATYAGAGFMGGAVCEWYAPASAIIHWGLNGSTCLADPQKRWKDCLSLNQFSRNPNNISIYKGVYKTIYTCNKIILSLQSSPVEQTYKDQIEAEARFIRGHCYFYIARRWGNAPIHLDVPTTIEQTYGVREDFWKLYGVALKDFEYTEEHGRTFEQQNKIAGRAASRICKNAGTANKALLYLTIGTLLAHSDPGDNFWTCSNEKVFQGFKEECGVGSAKEAFEKALAAAKEVMPETSTTGSPYKLANSYAQLFRWGEQEDWELPERIFVFPSTNEVSGSTLANWSLPNQYMGAGSNSTYARYVPSRFLFQKWCGTYGGVLGGGNAANIFVRCGDPRLDVSIVYGSYPGADMATKTNYPTAACVLTSTRPSCYPMFKKYYSPKYDASAAYSDLYVMRLAEVYLIAAEACANLCETPADSYGQESMKYVNILLARARRSGSADANGIITLNYDGSGTCTEPADWTSESIETKEDLIERIFWERAFEMCGEQHEVQDTHRMGASWLGQVVTGPHNAFLYLPEQDDNGSTKGYRSQYYGEPTFGPRMIYPQDPELIRKGLICAFPYEELIYNPALTMDDQNPSEVFWE